MKLRSETEQRVLRLFLGTAREATEAQICRGVGAKTIADRNLTIEAIETLYEDGILVKSAKRYSITPRLRNLRQKVITVKDTFKFKPPTPVSPPQVRVLEILSLVGGYCSPYEVATQANLPVKVVTSLLKRLEGEGKVHSIKASGKRYSISATFETKSILKSQSEKWVSLSIQGVGGLEVDEVVQLLTKAGVAVNLTATREGLPVDVVVNESKVVELVAMMVLDKDSDPVPVVKPRQKPKSKKSRSMGGGTALPGCKVNFRDPDQKDAYFSAVTDVISKNPGPISSTEILNIVGGSSNQVRQALQPLILEGLVTATGKARATRYEWTEQ